MCLVCPEVWPIRRLVDTVAAIEAAPLGSSTLRNLITGHLRFTTGIAAYERQDLAAAESDFVAAQNFLEAGASPFAGWAAFYRAICVYYSDADRAIALFRGIGAKFPAQRYPVLNGRIHWLLATALGVQGRDQEGLDHNARALYLLKKSSGEQEASFVHVLLAEAYDPLGEVELGWHHRLQALEGISLSGDHRRIHSMLNEASQALLRQGFAAQALTVMDELLANAALWPEHPNALVEGLTQKAQARLALGETEKALKNIRAARDFLKRMPISGLTEWHSNWLDLYEGLCYLERDPHRAVKLLTAAFERQNSAGHQWDRPRYLAERARAFLALGDQKKARADLMEAIAFYERTRENLQEVALKMHYFRLAQPAFEALVALDVQHRQGEATAFVTAERARARFFLDRRRVALRTSYQEPSFPRPENLVSHLSPDTALVEYAVLPSEVVAWVIVRESWHLVRLSHRKEEVEAQVERLRRDLERGAQEATIQLSAAPLYQALIQPLGLSEEITSLILVPDRFLLGLPFTALYDREAASYLVERYAVTLYPSSTLLRDDLTRPRDGARSGPVLVIGASAAEGRLPALLSAEEEARQVGALYPQAEILVGPDATRRRARNKLPQARVVHIASHAAANAEMPSRSRIFLNSGDDNGSLTAADLWQLDLDGVELFVLASCESMAGQVEGREALFGLAGGLLAAGVDAVVASLWRVEDKATADLMVAFHRHYRKNNDAARALQMAILETLALKRGNRPPPGSWAAFATLGGIKPN